MTTVAPSHPSSTLVNISDDADIRLIRVLAPSCTSSKNNATFEKDCATSISNGDAAGLLRTVIANGAIAGLLSTSYTLDEAVSAFSLLTVYLNRVGEESVAKKLCGELTKAVATTAEGGGDVVEGSKGEKQVAMIAALFNLRTDANEKIQLLTNIVTLANVTSLSPSEQKGVNALADMLEVSNLKALCTLWGNVENAELRALYSAVSKGMDRVLASLEGGANKDDKSNDRKVKAAMEQKQAYMLLFLETYKDEPQLDKEATSTALQASIYAIRNPINLFSYQRRILSLPAISSLSKSQPALFDLLKIFMEGKIQDYRDFTAMPDKNSVFGQYNLDEEECRRNMCLLSLVSLAGEHEEIPYSAVASTLNVKEAEVEQWVIRAVSSGLMEAKMDQLRKVVLVERCAVRQFGSKEWTALKNRLDTWKANVSGVLDALKKSGAVGPEGP